jgi:DNA-binding protein HU-beta
MTKKEIIENVATAAGISKAAAERAVNTMMESIKESLASGDNVLLVGFGRFSVRERAPRKCRNPKTGEIIEIPARKVVKFKPGEPLRKAIA